MIARKEINKLVELESKQIQLQEEMKMVGETFSELRLKALQTVKMEKRDGTTVALVDGARRLTVSYNTQHNEYTLKEKGKVVCKQMRCSIHDLRYAIAIGEI